MPGVKYIMKRNIKVGVDKPHISRAYGYWFCWFGVEGDGGSGVFDESFNGILGKAKLTYSNPLYIAHSL